MIKGKYFSLGQFHDNVEVHIKMAPPEAPLHPPHLGWVVWASNAMQYAGHTSGSEPPIIVDGQETANVLANLYNLLVAETLRMFAAPISITSYIYSTETNSSSYQSLIHLPLAPHHSRAAWTVVMW